MLQAIHQVIKDQECVQTLQILAKNWLIVLREQCQNKNTNRRTTENALCVTERRLKDGTRKLSTQQFRLTIHE